MRAGFAQTNEDMRAGFARVDQDMRGLRAEINRIWLLSMSFGGGIIVALIGVIAGLLARGA